ncbi:Uncharacterised protein [Schaalia odontolytica]|uniref:Uncharacterized protein n=1 Tax=Schaalia odontolytica TaxID=1660 RepID=A0A6N2T9B8_9ACTO
MNKQAVKTAVKAVLDATSDALDEIPASPYSCSAAQLKIRATLETIADQLLHLLVFINLDGESE